MQFPRHVENLIADLRGLPRDHSRSRDRAAVPLGSLLEVIVEKHQLEHPGIEQQVSANWREIVGQGTAHRCAPQRILDSGRTLVIFAANPVIRQELLFAKRQIIKRLKSIEGCETLERIEIRCG